LIKALKAFDHGNVKFLTGGNGPAAYNLERDDYVKHRMVIAVNLFFKFLKKKKVTVKTRKDQ